MTWLQVWSNFCVLGTDRGARPRDVWVMEAADPWNLSKVGCYWVIIEMNMNKYIRVRHALWFRSAELWRSNMDSKNNILSQPRRIICGDSQQRCKQESCAVVGFEFACCCGNSIDYKVVRQHFPSRGVIQMSRKRSLYWKGSSVRSQRQIHVSMFVKHHLDFRNDCLCLCPDHWTSHPLLWSSVEKKTKLCKLTFTCCFEILLFFFFLHKIWTMLLLVFSTQPTWPECWTIPLTV